MHRCEFGFYCPPGTIYQIQCPAGTYGSGNPNNFDVDSACWSCGRGLYSIQEEPNKCSDCLEGYVCLGRTNSTTPRKNRDNGYKCPLGHYCPTGSYEETPCPVGRYGKKLGLTKEDDCIKCKVNHY